MSFITPRSSFFNATAAVLIAGSLGIAAVPANSEPVITYNHPPGTNLLGGAQTRRVDCATLIQIPRASGGKPELFATCKFAEQVDANGQSICTDPSPLPTDPAQLRAHTSFALALSIQHFGRAHGVCVPQAVNLDRSLGKSEADLDKLYPGHRTANRHCPLTEAAAQCRRALGLD